ncbi:MAG: hypothetical protein GXP32_02315 [Kiritimatiellaeota bacterium]|nr:hypothetical protein [Kiritimatiellota bacterium]
MCDRPEKKSFAGNAAKPSECIFKRVFIVAVFLLAVVSVTLHFVELDVIPNGFYGDECAIGYNAWSILETGRDEYGTFLPVFFRCFDNYHDPVMVYTIAPLIKVWGLSKWVVRMPSGIYLLLASIAFYFLVFNITRNRYASLGSAFLFSLSPWVFPVSRSTMSGYTPMLLGIVLGCFFLRKMMRKRSMPAAFFAGLAWAFVMYSHNCGRPATAAFLASFVVAYCVSIIKRKRELVVFSFVFAISLLPLSLSFFSNPQAMTERFNQISVWRDSPGILECARRITMRYVDYFSPSFLFLIGDDNPRHNTGVGELFIFTLPFIILGLFWMVRRIKRDPFARFVLLSLIVYPCAAILTMDYSHSTRSLDGFPFWMLLTGVGASRFLLCAGVSEFGKSTMPDDSFLRRVVKLALVVILGLGIFEICGYFSDYFRDDGYQQRSRMAFDAPLVEALEYVEPRLGDRDVLYLTRSIYPEDVDENFKPYKYATLLFFLKIPPKDYQAHGISSDQVVLYSGGPLEKSGFLVAPGDSRVKSGLYRFGLSSAESNVVKVKLLKKFLSVHNGLRDDLKLYSVSPVDPAFGVLKKRGSK